MPACATIMGELDPRRVVAPEAPEPAAGSGSGASPIWIGDHNSDSWCAAWISGRYIVADELALLHG